MEAAALSNQPAGKGKHAQQHRAETILSPQKDVYTFTKLFLHEKVLGNFRFSYGSEKSCRTLFKKVKLPYAEGWHKSLWKVTSKRGTAGGTLMKKDLYIQSIKGSGWISPWRDFQDFRDSQPVWPLCRDAQRSASKSFCHFISLTLRTNFLHVQIPQHLVSLAASWKLVIFEELGEAD